MVVHDLYVLTYAVLHAAVCTCACLWHVDMYCLTYMYSCMLVLLCTCADVHVCVLLMLLQEAGFRAEQVVQMVSNV